MGNKTVQGQPLGRFEYVTGGSNKFYECVENGTGGYRLAWGKIGQKLGPRNTMTVSAWEAAKKVREKINKGYRHVPGSVCSLIEYAERDAEALTEAIEAVEAEAAAAAPTPRRARL